MFNLKIRFASWFFLAIYGFGAFLNAVGILITFWFIKGYIFGLGNTLIILSAVFYLVGLLQYELFLLLSSSQSITRYFSLYQLFAFAAIGFQILCYFISKYWTKQIAKSNLI